MEIGAGLNPMSEVQLKQIGRTKWDSLQKHRKGILNLIRGVNRENKGGSLQKRRQGGSFQTFKISNPIRGVNCQNKRGTLCKSTDMEEVIKYKILS